MIIRSRIQRWTAMALATATAIASVSLFATAPAQAAATGELTGKVFTASGELATDGTVYLHNPEDQEIVAETNIRADGKFVFNVAPGDYIIQIYAGNGGQFYHRKLSPYDADVVTVVAGGTVTVQESLLAYGTLRGTVRDAAGNPAAAVEVEATGAETGSSHYGYTDEEGRYDLTVVADSYTIGFRLPGNNYYAVQYAPSALNQQDAASYEIKEEGHVYDLDVDLLPTGSLSGTFTSFGGAPLRNASVVVTGVGSDVENWVEADSNGHFELSPVFAGQYKVRFMDSDGAGQWAYGKLSAEDADVIEVGSGRDTVVNDSFLAPGSVKVKAFDAKTGAALTDFCASYHENEACTTTGEVLLTGVPRGEQEINVYSRDGYLTSEWVTVQVGADVAEVTVRLTTTGALTAKVVDKATGRPVADVCLAATKVGSPVLPDGYGDCSRADGKVRLDRLTPGRYNVFADPSDESGLGAQWVGRSGGTGDPYAAQVVTVTGAATSTVATIALDAAGSIGGVMTDQVSGQPLAYGYVSLSSYSFGGGPHGGVDTDDDGRYRLDGLGPYPWALNLTAPGHAPQWSGAKANRLFATKVAVTAGRTATFNPAMAVGTEVVGRVVDGSGSLLPGSYVFAWNALTHDFMGGDWAEDGEYRALVMGPQLVKLEYYVPQDEEGLSGWYDRAADFEHAKPVLVPRTGTKTVNISVPAS